MGTVRPVGHHAGGRPDFVYGDLVQLIVEPAHETLRVQFLPDCAFAEVGKQEIPVRILGVKGSQFFTQVDVCDIGNEHRVTQIVSGAGKAAGQLQRHCKTLTEVVEGRDLQLWHVKAFAKHVHADDDARLALVELAARRLSGDLLHAAVKHNWIEMAECLVDCEHLCSPNLRGYARHGNVQTGGIGAELFDDLGGDVAIGSGVVEGIHRAESDGPEIALALCLPHGIDVNDLAVQGHPVFPERCSGELQDMPHLGLDNRLERVPGRCRSVMGLVDE